MNRKQKETWSSIIRIREAPNETVTYIFESQSLFALYSGKQMSSMNDLLKIRMTIFFKKQYYNILALIILDAILSATQYKSTLFDNKP